MSLQRVVICVGLLVTLAPRPADAVKFRRPFKANIGLGHGFDHNFGAAGCKDWNCKGTCYDGHSGSDFPLPMGTVVLAAAAGKVVAVNQGCKDVGYLGNLCGGMCGNHVKLQHSDGTTSLYCHMKNGAMAVKKGQKVTCGQKLGKSASSGNSTGAHLHFGWKPPGSSVYKDPFKGKCASKGAWVSQGAYPGKPGTTCEVVCACSPGAKKTQACGKCGEKTRTCKSSCQWGDWSSCKGQGECVAGNVQNGACDNCGTKQRTCSGKCAWKAWTECAGSGPCAADEVQTTACGTCGAQERTCTSGCSWGDWSECSGQGDCLPGEAQAEPCGNCGVSERSCDDGCQWSAWSGCQGQGACSPGAQELSKCCDCGTMKRSCDLACGWTPWSSCEGSATPEDPACDTGLPGACSAGALTCEDGCNTCNAVAEASAERCDGVDNDCDGLTDEDSSELSDPPPPHAAVLEHLSAPDSLQSGEIVWVSAVFRNVGASSWAPQTAWLAASGSFESISGLRVQSEWAGTHVASVSSEATAPGETVEFSFPIQRDPDRPAATRFQLTVDSQPVLCPSPSFELSPEALAGDAGEDESVGGQSTDGCASAPPSASGGPAPWAGWLPLTLLLLLLAARRAGGGHAAP